MGGGLRGRKAKKAKKAKNAGAEVGRARMVQEGLGHAQRTVASRVRSGSFGFPSLGSGETPVGVCVFQLVGKGCLHF